MFTKWFEVLSDGGIGWGSNADMGKGEYMDISEGTALTQLVYEKEHEDWTELPVKIWGRLKCRTFDSSGKTIADTARWRVRLRANWELIDGNFVAVRFKGNAPKLIVLKGHYSDWWGISPDYTAYDDDRNGGVAYFKSSSIKLNWEAYSKSSDMSPIDNIAVSAADSGNWNSADAALETEVLQVAVVHQHKWGHPQVTATCTEAGVSTRICELDETHVVTHEVPALGHDWRYQVEEAPTLARAGVKALYCARCGVRQEGSEAAVSALIDLEEATCSVSESSFTYDGTVHRPDITVKAGSKMLEENVDYAIEWPEDCRDAGICEVVVRGMGEFGGAVTIPFEIKPKVVKPEVMLAKTALVHTGKPLMPVITVQVDGQDAPLASSAYEVTWANNVNVGTATANVSLKGNFSGSASGTFHINPKGTSLASVKAVKKGFRAKWKKQVVQTTGYQLQYAANARFVKAKMLTAKKAKVTSKVVSKLKAGKRYYVRVRTFKRVGVEKYYSNWSAVKRVRVKLRG